MGFHKFHPIINFYILLTTFVLAILLQSVYTLEVLYNKEICDEDVFYNPYAKISKTRKGPIIIGVYKTGFIDTRSYAGVLCINGPAFLYSEMDGDLYIKPDIQVFSHACLTFNRRKQAEYHQGGGLSPITMDTEIYGQRIFGVVLVSEAGDFRKPEFKWFKSPGFEHLEPAVNVNGSSFAMVLSGPPEKPDAPPSPTSYCFEAPRINTEGKLKGNSGVKPQFCYREDENSDFDEAFHRNLSVGEYNWTACDSEGGGGTTTDLDTTNPEQLPDFRIIDPAFLKAMGSPGKVFKGKVVIKPADSIPFYSRPHPPGYFFNGEDGYLPFVPEANSLSQQSSITERPKPFRNVQADMKECEDLPELEDDCTLGGDDDNACDLFRHVLTIDKVKWKEPEPDGKLIAASWRQEIFTLISKIYQNACPQVSKTLAPAVTRVVEYFIKQVAALATPSAGGAGGATTTPPSTAEKKYKILNDAKNNGWNELVIPDLQRCLEYSMKMPFYRTRDLNNEKKKKDIEQILEQIAMNPNASDINPIELEDQLKDVRIMFPYFIWLPPLPQWTKKSPIQIFEYVEAAEVDYDLDWAIDTFWKVFSTVLGYCNRHYELRKSATSPTFNDLFASDVMTLVYEQWIHSSEPDGASFIFGNFENIYDHLFGEFKNGVASRYIDACHDGSYWWSNTPSFRQLRPILLKDGEDGVDKNGTIIKHTNFFIEQPAWRGGD